MPTKAPFPDMPFRLPVSVPFSGRTPLPGSGSSVKAQGAPQARRSANPRGGASPGTGSGSSVVSPPVSPPLAPAVRRLSPREIRSPVGGWAHVGIISGVSAQDPPIHWQGAGGDCGLNSDLPAGGWRCNPVRTDARPDTVGFPPKEPYGHNPRGVISAPDLHRCR